MRGRRSEQAFELRVTPQAGGEYEVGVWQVGGNGGRRNGRPRPVARIWGTPLLAVTDQVLEALRKEGYRPSDLRRSRKAPFPLSEERGVRLALLFLSTKPLRKLERIEAVSRGVREMEAEEAYYWYAKCTKSDRPRRACRALRILLSEE